MAKRNSAGDSGKGTRGDLGVHQREFMEALQRAVEIAGGPASVPEIVAQLGKSDSRVRSHVKRLTEMGYVCRMGKAKRTRYTPSMRWLDEPGAREDLIRYIGGQCERHGCSNPAESYYRNQYVCRECMMGEKDDPFGRDSYYRSLSLQSAAGDLLLESPGVIGTTKSRRRKRKKTEGRDGGNGYTDSVEDGGG